VLSATDTQPTEAVLWIYDQIGSGFFSEGVTPAWVRDELLAATKAGAQRLTVYVNSPGGDMFDGLAIYEQLRRWPGEKTVVVDGLAASIASVIAMAGDHIRIAPAAMMMVHEPWALSTGNSSEMRATADLLDKAAAGIRSTYAERTKQTPERIAELMAAETWLTADESVAAGFADDLVPGPAQKDQTPESSKSAAAMSAVLAQFKRAPECAARLLNLALP
jgi:ATP-dependent Clp protease protease subunit